MLRSLDYSVKSLLYSCLPIKAFARAADTPLSGEKKRGAWLL